MRPIRIAALSAMLVTASCGLGEEEKLLNSFDLGGTTLEVRYRGPVGSTLVGSHRLRFYSMREGREHLVARTFLRLDSERPKDECVRVERRTDGDWTVTVEGVQREVWVLDASRNFTVMDRLDQ